ncbi:hypothetical protein ACN4EK_13435 [Pantanalinema rosaneae CENA516]|uniref:hypothetical protein n=1 Tax=Pantanalinema rosaneae TaxID=1620701 RepID=UPI003D6F437E
MDNNQRVGILKQNLPLLDFNSAKKKFEQLICEFDVDEQGGSAVFLIQKSQAMLGEICLQGIQDTIRVKPGETLKPYRLEFFPGVTWDEKEILRALGKQLGKFEEVTDIDRYAQEIRKILIGALRGYTTLFIELHGWDILTEQQQKRLLHWFLEDFWKHLVAERDRIAEDYDNVRCIAAIVVAGELEPDLQQLPYFQCTSENWQGEIKIIELPLENWTTKDIEEWLKKCPKLSKKDSKAMAERIYRITKGLPIAARDRLEKELQIYCPIAS